MFSFIETKLFSRLLDDYLTDDEYALLQGALIDSPERGALVPGSGGVRKLRWAQPGRSRGAESGAGSGLSITPRPEKELFGC